MTDASSVEVGNVKKRLNVVASARGMRAALPYVTVLMLDGLDALAGLARRSRIAIGA